MYLVGAEHPHKIDAQRLLERCISDNERLVTDAEVLQEILHRYVAIDRKEAIMPALQAVLGLVMERHQVTTIMSFDSGFDGYPGLKRFSTL